MTKKDFERIAEAISNTTRTVHVDGRGVAMEMVPLHLVITEIADALAKDNPRFDRTRFVDAAASENYRAPRGTSLYDF